MNVGEEPLATSWDAVAAAVATADPETAADLLHRLDPRAPWRPGPRGAHSPYTPSDPTPRASLGHGRHAPSGHGRYDGPFDGAYDGPFDGAQVPWDRGSHVAHQAAVTSRSQRYGRFAGEVRSRGRAEEPGDAVLLWMLGPGLAGRTAEWRAEFATLAALKLAPGPRRRGGPGQGVRTVLALLRHTGVTPPEHDPLVVAWAACTPDAAGLRADPLLDHLVPRMFDAEGVGALLRDERADPPRPRSWLAALHELAGDGRIGRDLLLDGCLRRFLRGGQPADLRFFVRLHELLQPTDDEVSRRRRAYLGLLPAAPGAVAEPVLRHVRRLGDLEAGDVTEAVRALLLRPERKLQTAGVTWLDEAAAGDPAAGLDALAPALGCAFGSESTDVQGRAVRVAVKHAKRFTAEGARAIREAMAVLPQELAETLAAVFGPDAADGPGDLDGFTPVSLPAPVEAGAFPAPVRAAYELGPCPRDDWQGAERWLAGVVHLYGHAREALTTRLTEHRPPPPGPWLDIGHWAQAIARLVTGTVVPSAADGSSPVGDERLPGLGDVPGPHLFLLRRWAEVHDALAAGTLPPYLLAEPTEGSGLLDPEMLVERLSGYERAGVEALPADLQQALLRLPRDIPPHAAAQAARLASEAGRVAARWMNGERPEPIAELIWSCRVLGGPDTATPVPGTNILPPAPPAPGVHVLPPGSPVGGDAGHSGGGGFPAGDGGERSGEAAAGESGPWQEGWACCAADTGPVLDRAHELSARLRPAGPTGLEFVDGLFSGSVAHRLRDHGGYLGWWPHLMPSDREAVAAHCVPHLMERWRRVRMETAQAQALAAAGGPPGEALALVVAYLVADRARGTAEERARPVVELAARGELDAERVGRRLALLIQRTELKPGPAFETLEAAAAFGAQREVWRIVTAFLPGFLPAPGERSHTRHTQGLVFALRAARWAGARGAVPCVAEIAQRKASNNFVREARRLHTYLT
ncbi:hypothetical protein ACFFR3_13495 [Nonomuraea salmonea]|uniref:DUF7824 domain-containing protein n=1 Tax=Nonomuraea salmonea TaxID=46181 RepID=A0ABV5NJQ9_9ACTN